MRHPRTSLRFAPLTLRQEAPQWKGALVSSLSWSCPPRLGIKAWPISSSAGSTIWPSAAIIYRIIYRDHLQPHALHDVRTENLLHKSTDRRSSPFCGRI